MFWCYNCQKPVQSINSFKCQFCSCQAIEEIDQHNHPQNYQPYESSDVHYQNPHESHQNLNQSFGMFNPFGLMNQFSMMNTMLNPRNNQIGNNSFFRMVLVIDPQQEENKKKLLSQQKIQEFQKVWLSQDCAICQQNDGQGMKLPCKHEFHQHCILPWFQEANTCPCCRAQL